MKNFEYFKRACEHMTRDDLLRQFYIAYRKAESIARSEAKEEEA